MTAKKRAAKAKNSAEKSRSKRKSPAVKKPAAKRAAKARPEKRAPKHPALPRAQRPPKTVTRDYFLAMRAPRVGQHNPHKLSNPVWEWLVKNPELSAYSANAHFDGPTALLIGPGFCNMRFGQSRTELADERVLLIGGEHEDYYDPDFYIYNDVIVLHPSGVVDVYCYPHDAFAPTDHHSATLADGRVIVIGGLSYDDRRIPEKTLVYSLSLDTFAMSPVHTEGAPPGWIFDHTAELSADGQHITVRGGSIITVIDEIESTVENNDEWTLDLRTMRWTHSKQVQWPQWRVQRSDGRGHRLYLIESMAFMRDDRSSWGKSHFEALKKDFGGVPDFALYEKRYTPPVAHEVIDDRDDEYPKVARRVIDGVTTRFIEEMDGVRVVFEGALSEPLMRTIVDDLQDKLARLEGAECEVKRLK